MARPAAIWQTVEILQLPTVQHGISRSVRYTVYCASHKNWTWVHQLPLQKHCFIGSGGDS